MTDNPLKIIRVVVQRPLYQMLDYKHDGTQSVVIGGRVKVPLGNTLVTAIVIAMNVTSRFDNLKPVSSLIDDKPLLDTPMLELLKWASKYYFYPPGEVIFHALPAQLRKGRALPKIRIWKKASGTSDSSLQLLSRAPKQQNMLALLLANDCDEIELKKQCGKQWRSILRELQKKDLVEFYEQDIDLDTENEINKDSVKPKLVNLTEEQENCLKKLTAHFATYPRKPVLLHGITGSGKTEIYLRFIAPLIATGQQVLVMVPEIGLTPQLHRRFKEFYPDLNTVMLHSSLSDSERTKVWLQAKMGAVQIIIGTRSAVFTPFQRIGAIIVDEEHDASFKQQEGFLYQGRDLAIKRAHDANIPVLLGSATPSLESIYNVEQNRYEYLHLASRPGESIRPGINLLDIREMQLDAGISQTLMSEIRQHINSKQQVMLFLNRRGFAPVLMCKNCGWHASCDNCDTGMTYHARLQKTICHHCGFEKKITANCIQCNSSDFTTLGQGTERIEEVLKSYFPDTPVIRIDRDSTSHKGQLEKKLAIVNQGKPVILVGTQMLTKGHDFPNLTLVGILDVDQALFSMDFRAQERLAQQIVQVAGRAGRANKPGTVVLQTSQSQHPILLSLLSNGYYQTAKQILNERKQWGYPPIGAQALIRVNAEKLATAYSFIKKLKDDLSDNILNAELYGPVPSPLAKRANRYRFQLLVAAGNRKQIHADVSVALSYLIGYRKTGGVRWNIDIDPSDFL